MTDNDVFDLQDELAMPTQERNFNTAETVEEITTEAQNIAAEFAPEFDAEKLEETIKDTAAENIQAMYDTSALAPAIVDGADAIISQIFPILYEKSAFTEEERNALKVLGFKIANSKNNKETTLDDQEIKLGALYADYEAYKESLPLTEKEKQTILKPLAKMLENVNVQTTPQNALLLAVFMVMLPRLLPLGINKFIKQ